MTKLAVVLFNLGGPDSLKSVKPFLFNLFRDPAIITLPALARYPLAALISTTRERRAQGNYALMGGASPLLAETGAQTIGKFVMGTVKGDVHDIGKNLVVIMLEGAGFTVIDLGVNVPPEKFVEEIKRVEPDVVGFSAFLTTTMPMFKANINALEKAGIRDNVIVLVGGAPVTQEYADKVGADGYAADASTAVRLAKDLIQKKRAAVPA